MVLGIVAVFPGLYTPISDAPFFHGTKEPRRDMLRGMKRFMLCFSHLYFRCLPGSVGLSGLFDKGPYGFPVIGVQVPGVPCMARGQEHVTQ